MSTGGDYNPYVRVFASRPQTKWLINPTILSDEITEAIIHVLFLVLVSGTNSYLSKGLVKLSIFNLSLSHTHS